MFDMWKRWKRWYQYWKVSRMPGKIMIFDKNGWRKETKEEVLLKVDIENNRPCDFCWEDARDNGIYSWPLKIDPKDFIRCSCGRMIGTK